MIADGPGIESQPDISPDDRWLAFASDISGCDEVHVIELPEGVSWTRISTATARSGDAQSTRHPMGAAPSSAT